VLSKSETRLVEHHLRVTLYRYGGEALDALQASLAAYLGHLKRASCRRLVAAIWARAMRGSMATSNWIEGPCV